MIVEQNSRVFTGSQACMEAALQAGCRSYFAAPSPFQALLLNEGAQRFSEAHGNFVQAAHPVEALSMALGAATVGMLPLVSATYPDFLAMQEVLQYLCQQSCACVMMIVLTQPPPYPQASPLAYAYPCFLDPWPASGLPLLSLMPSNLERLYQLTQEAFQLAATLSQPVLLLLDPLLLSLTAELQLPASEPLSLPQPEGAHWFERVEAAWPHVKASSPRWLRQWQGCEMPTDWLLATGALGGWLLASDWPDMGVMVPESLSPWPVWPEQVRSVTVVEFAPGSLGLRLQHRNRGRTVRRLALPYSRYAPVGLQAQVLKALEAPL